MAEDPWAEFRTPSPSASGGSPGGSDEWAAFREQSAAATEGPPTPGWRERLRAGVIDVAKQIPSGLVAGTEAIATFPAQVAGMVAPLANRYLLSDPEAEQRQAELRGLIAAQRGEGIAQYLPKPQTTAGHYARTAAEFVPSTVAGTGLAIPRAVGVGATAGLVSEAAGQATEGTAAEPYARIGAGLVGGTVALRQAEQAAARAAIPSIDQLRERAGQLYDQVRASGLEIKPAAAAAWAQRQKADLTQSGLSDDIAQKTWRTLDKVENAPAGATMTAANFQALRKTLGRAAGSLDPQERLAGVQTKNSLDDFLANLSPADVRRGNPQEASALLGEANRNYAAAERAATVDKRITRAELQAASTHSGLNLENQLRQQMAQVLNNPAQRRGWSPQDLAEMERIARGGNIGNLGRWTYKLLGGGGGLGALGAGGAGGAINYALGGDPAVGAVAAPAAGLGLAVLGNRSTLARTQALQAAARARSPLAGQVPFTAPAPAAPFAAFLPPQGRTLADLGQE